MNRQPMLPQGGLPCFTRPCSLCNASLRDRLRASFAGLLVLLPTTVSAAAAYTQRKARQGAVMNVTVPLKMQYNHTAAEHQVGRV